MYALHEWNQMVEYIFDTRNLDLQLPVRARKLLADVTLQVGIRPRHEVAHVTADQHFHVAFTVTRGV